MDRTMAKAEFDKAYDALLSKYGSLQMHTGGFSIDSQILAMACATGKWRITEETETIFLHQGAFRSVSSMCVDLNSKSAAAGTSETYNGKWTGYPTYDYDKRVETACRIKDLIPKLADLAPLEMLSAIQSVVSNLEKEKREQEEEESYDDNSDEEDFLSDEEDSIA